MASRAPCKNFYADPEPRERKKKKVNLPLKYPKHDNQKKKGQSKEEDTFCSQII